MEHDYVYLIVGSFWILAFLIGSYISKKDIIKHTNAKAVLDRLISLSGQKVLALEQTEIALIKSRFSKGTITKEQLPSILLGVKELAISTIKRDATAQGIWNDAVNICGSPESVELWLKDLIESQVAQIPSSGLKSAIVIVENKEEKV